MGALSVLTTAADPTPDEQAFLDSLAHWTAHRVAAPAGPTVGAGPCASAERAAAVRTARIAELMTDLSDAVTAHDVAQVVADRVLPLFGAQGLVVEVFENGLRQVVGSRGYPEEFLDSVVNTPQPARSPFQAARRRRPPLHHHRPGAAGTQPAGPVHRRPPRSDADEDGDDGRRRE